MQVTVNIIKSSPIEHLIPALATLCTSISQHIQCATPFEIHTPPVEDLPLVLHKGSIDIKWIILLYIIYNSYSIRHLLGTVTKK